LPLVAHGGFWWRLAGLQIPPEFFVLFVLDWNEEGGGNV
jgi:hypothetical protein